MDSSQEKKLNYGQNDQKPQYLMWLWHDYQTDPNSNKQFVCSDKQAGMQTVYNTSHTVWEESTSNSLVQQSFLLLTELQVYESYKSTNL